MTWQQELNDFSYKLGYDVKHVGLKSIQETEVKIENGTMLVPDKYKGIGLLYYRDKKPREVQANLEGMEDYLNLFFDVVFSLAADEFTTNLLFSDFKFEDIGPWHKLGHRSAPIEVGWGEGNVMQPDSFFVSPKSIVNVEIKLKAESSAKQLLSYVALTLAWERQNSKRDKVGFLLIVPQSSIGLIDKLPRGEKIITEGLPLSNRKITKIIEENRARADEICEQLRLVALSWSELDRRIAELITSLGNTPSDATVRKLFEGFREQLKRHKYTEVGLP